MNLGTKIEEGPMTKPMTEGDGKKMSYPSMSITDEKCDAFLKECPVDLHDVITGTFKGKVTGLRADQFGKSLTLDIIEINDPTCESAGEEEEEDESSEEGEDEESPPKKSGGKVSRVVRRMMDEDEEK